MYALVDVWSTTIGKKLQEVLSTVEALDVGAAVEVYTQQLLDHEALAWQDLQGIELPRQRRHAMLEALAMRALLGIKESPELADGLVRKIAQESADPSLRCGLAAMLAYFTKRLDIIDDDAPGGYGFTDDSILLRAGALVYGKDLRLQTDTASSPLKRVADLGILCSCLARKTLRACQEKIGGVLAIRQVLDGLPRAVVEDTFVDLLERPSEARIPDVPVRDEDRVLSLLEAKAVARHTGIGTDKRKYSSILSLLGGASLAIDDAGELVWLSP